MTFSITKPTDSIEVKLTAKQHPQFYIDSLTVLLKGLPEKLGKAAKPPVDEVVLLASGKSVGTAALVAGMLQKKGIAEISSLKTKTGKKPEITISLKLKEEMADHVECVSGDIKPELVPVADNSWKHDCEFAPVIVKDAVPSADSKVSVTSNLAAGPADPAKSSGVKKLIGENFVTFVEEGDVKNKQQKPSEHFDSGLKEYKLSSPERLVRLISLYTGNSVYNQMNAAMREDSEDGLRRYGILIAETRDAFRSDYMEKQHMPLSPFLGTVFRGVSLQQTSIDSYKVGQEVTWPAFSSTSNKKGTAFGGNVIFEIHCSKMLEHVVASEKAKLYVPAEIAKFSQYKGENEVLFPPYTRFRVVSHLVDGSKRRVVLETIEFPPINEMISTGNWQGVQQYLDAQQKKYPAVGKCGNVGSTDASDTDTQVTNWLSYAGNDVMHAVAKQIAVAKQSGNDVSQSAGLDVFTKLWGMGCDPTVVSGSSGTSPFQVMQNAGVSDNVVQEPNGQVLWLFDASSRNIDDQQRQGWLHHIDGRTFQKYCARDCALLEHQLQSVRAWIQEGQFQYLHSSRGDAWHDVDITIMNNIGREINYNVSIMKDGRIFQQAKPGQGMIGNAREVKRFVAGEYVGTDIEMWLKEQNDKKLS